MYITTTSGEVVLYISWVIIKVIIFADCLYFLFEYVFLWIFKQFKKIFITIKNDLLG